MRTLASICLIMFAAVSINFAQIVRITPKKTVYTRKSEISSETKRTFTVIYPRVGGALSSRTKKQLADTISYWRVFEMTLQENLSKFDGLDELSYKVNFNRKNILDIALTQETSAAYPDQSTVDLVIDLQTGRQAQFDDVFRAAPRLAKIVNVKLKAEVKEILRQIDRGDFGESTAESDAYLKEKLNSLNFTEDTFNEYSVSSRGITIIYNAEFPHVAQAVQPAGRYFFTWAELKPFIKPDGLLGKFVS